MPLPAEVLIFAFILSGVSLKLADFYDKKSIGYIFASISAVSLGLLLSDSAKLASIVLGIILGSALSGKIDQPNLMFGLVLTLITAITISLLSTVFPLPNFPLLILFTAAALMDEVGHDKITSSNIFAGFFRFRMTLKLIIICSAIFSLIDIIYAIGFFCFDLSYDAVNFILEYPDRSKTTV